MKRKRISKWIATGLSIAMMFGIVNLGIIEVMAEENTAPSLAQYVDVNDLSSSFNLNGGTVGKIKFGLNGSKAREWFIAGADGENTLALISATSFGTSRYDNNNSIYGDDSSNPIIESTVLNYLRYICLGSSYFSSSEKNWMKDTIVTSEDYQRDSYAVNSKLYLPDVAGEITEDMKPTTIYVGSGNDIPINLLATNRDHFRDSFWLRSTGFQSWEQSSAWLGIDGSYATVNSKDSECAVLPAFDMNLSSVLFASSAPAASSFYSWYMDENNLAPEEQVQLMLSSYSGEDMTASMVANTFTLRYASTGSESATCGNSAIEVSGATSKMYLVVQNSDGAWLQRVSGTTTVNASAVTINGSALTSFENCKVWLESTDADRITTATKATKASPAQPSSLTITNGAGGTHQFNSDGTITSTCSGDLEDFADLYVDGLLVGGENYTVESGSTIVTLKAAYLDGLPVGTHTLTFLYWTGSVETTFSIVDGKDEVPKTGENMQVVWLLALMLVSGVGAIYVGKKRIFSKIKNTEEDR